VVAYGRRGWRCDLFPDKGGEDLGNARVLGEKCQRASVARTRKKLPASRAASLGL